jgi:hypothetical protein
LSIVEFACNPNYLGDPEHALILISKTLTKSV